METDHADDLIPFLDVRVVRATASSLLCRVGERSVWLSRAHVSGKLWCSGDRGKLFIRRWVALDRNLIDVHGAAVLPRVTASSRSRLPRQLHLVRGDRDDGQAR